MEGEEVMQTGQGEETRDRERKLALRRPFGVLGRDEWVAHKGNGFPGTPDKTVKSPIPQSMAPRVGLAALAICQQSWALLHWYGRGEGVSSH